MSAFATYTGCLAQSLNIAQTTVTILIFATQLFAVCRCTLLVQTGKAALLADVTQTRMAAAICFPTGFS
jgi:hypothetical protein